MLAGVEPVLETAVVQVVCLCIEGAVIDFTEEGVVNLLYIEHQEAAGAGGVVQKHAVVARAAERGDMWTVFLVAGVGCALLDDFQGDAGLQLVHLGGAHLVELFQADQGVLGQNEAVVTGHARTAGAHAVIPAPFGRKQVVEKGGLVDALRAHKHEDYLVDLVTVAQGGDDAYEPAAETFTEEVVIAGMDRGCQAADVVGAVPYGKGIDYDK